MGPRYLPARPPTSATPTMPPRRRHPTSRLRIVSALGCRTRLGCGSFRRLRRATAETCLGTHRGLLHEAARARPGTSVSFRIAVITGHRRDMSTARTELHTIARWAETHHGVITRSRALELGWSRARWYRAIDRGEIEPVHPGVARLHGTPRTRFQAIHAAVVAAGPDALASHRSAAALWGIERPAADPIDVIVRRDRTRLVLDGVEIHRPTDRVDLRPSFRHATSSCNLLRTLVDLGAVIGSVDDAVSEAITSGAVTPAVLEYLLARHARPGRAGVVALRRALAGWPLDGAPADSELEIRMAKLLQRHRLPAATFHAEVAGFEVDFLVDGTPVILECDGWDHHGRTREQFEWDRERDLVLGTAGYVVHHFTWRQVTRRGRWVADRIRSLIGTWAPGALEVSAATCRGG